MHKNLCICDNCKKQTEVNNSYDKVWIHVVGHNWFKIGFNNVDVFWSGECGKCNLGFGTTGNLGTSEFKDTIHPACQLSDVEIIDKDFSGYVVSRMDDLFKQGILDKILIIKKPKKDL